MYLVLTCNQHSSSIYMLKKIRKGSLPFDKLGICKNPVNRPMNAEFQNLQLKEINIPHCNSNKNVWCIR